MVRAVEGLNVRYINSPHASFYLLSRGLLDSKVFIQLRTHLEKKKEEKRKYAIRKS